MANKHYDTYDAKENRVKGGVGYLLFFLPLILCPQSKYGRFCANQGLIGLLALMVFSLAFRILGGILSWVPLVGWLINAVGTLVIIAILLIMIYLSYLACAKGDARELPVIGSLRILK